MTINNSWGYQPAVTNYKTPFEVISIFVDAVSNGGNLLLDIAPKENGTIPAEQVFVLKELGRWNAKHGEAIFNTVAGLPQGHFYGPSTLSKDSTTLFLFLPNQTAGNILVKGLDTKILDVEVVGTSLHLNHKVVGKISWSPVPGIVFIDVPENAKDKYVTVLKVKLEEPLKLYRGRGGLN
jgi:alpha-L-fucosidase